MPFSSLLCFTAFIKEETGWKSKGKELNSNVFVAVHYDSMFVIKTHNEIEDFCKLLFFAIHRTALNVRLDYLSGYSLSQWVRSFPRNEKMLDVFKFMKTPKQPSGAFIHYQGHFFVTFI